MKSLVTSHNAAILEKLCEITNFPILRGDFVGYFLENSSGDWVKVAV